MNTASIPTPIAKRRRGGVILEVALALTMITSLAFGVVEFGYYFSVRSSLESAAFAGARAGEFPKASNTSVTNAVTTALASYNYPSGSITTSITDTSGNTWSLKVKSADGTELTYVVDSGTSVDGGETGVSSIAQNDTVRVLAVVSNGTATAKQITDSTVLKSNGQSWMPSPPSSGSDSGSGSTTTG